MGRFLNCCCGDPPPVYLEAKLICLQAPFPGFTRWISATTHSSAWETRKYLIKTSVKSDPGGTQVGITEYDEDNGSQLSTVTNNGWTGAWGAFISSSFNDTVANYSYEFGYETITLSSPIELSDKIELWAQRFNPIAALDVLRNPTTIEARAGWYPYAPDYLKSDTLSVIHEFASRLTAGAYSYIVLKPWRGISTFELQLMPWDGTYYFNYLTNPTVRSGVEYYTPGFSGLPYGGTPVIGTAANPNWNNLPVWDAGISAFRQSSPPAFINLVRSCLSLPHGLNCDLTQFQSDTNYELGDVVQLDFDYATGIYTQRSTALSLAPGYYGFDGRQMLIFSGSRLSGGGDGITTEPDPYYAESFARMAIAGTPTTNPRKITDYCPP